ncbi:MAG: arginine--tRNA ligase, partial [Actinomycetota bacterium]|nr:arginine--tRNA ligase [Actinomycetota bacterium]
MIQDILTSALRGALRDVGVDPVPERIPVERSNRPEHGDWSSSVALAAAKASGRKPREIADAVAARLMSDPPAYVAEVTVAGPGFVNFRLHDRWLHDVLTRVLEQGVDGYARHGIGTEERVNLEFVSANPTGPLHVGAGRWAVYGDALARIMQRCGYGVHREYYVNDRGVQMGLFAESLAAAKAGAPTPEEGYQGRYISDWAAEMPDGADPAAWAHDRVLADIGGALSRLGVEFDTWFSEKSMVDSGAVDAALADLRASGLVYEADGAVWLRTTQLGLSKDEVLLKTGGEPTYLLGDLAYHRDKFTRGFTRLIDVWGADHHGHVARLKAGVAALGHDPAELEIV